MRRLSIVVHLQWAQKYNSLFSVRLIKRKLSPDRTPDEEIQDRQNSFVWSEKHIFRPHQHFTYDPCSWSRPLEEKIKAKCKLTLVERLKMLEEREKEAQLLKEKKEYEEKMGTKREISDFIANADEDANYFYSLEDVKPPPVPLQDMLERINEIHILLTAPRHSNISLKMIERLQEEYSKIILCVFERVRMTVVGETMTFDALLYSWFLLLQGAEPLLEALTNKKNNEEDIHQAIITVHTSLDNIFINASNFFQKNSNELIIFEGWIELFDVVTHPFTRRGYKLREESSNLVISPKETLSIIKGIYEKVIYSLANRMMNIDSSNDNTEIIDPQHLVTFLRSIRRYLCFYSNMEEEEKKQEEDELFLQRISLLTKKVIEGLLDILKGVVSPSSKHSVKIALLGKAMKRTPLNLNSESNENFESKISHHPVILDVCGPPNGIKSPVTNADDALHITRACIALIEITKNTSIIITQMKILETIDAFLIFLSYTPNYDLSIIDTVNFVCELLESKILNIDKDNEERNIRILLLLSRIQFSMCNEQSLLRRLICCMCYFNPSNILHLSLLDEWKRLYGLVMHNLLHTVRAEEMFKYNNNNNNSQTWEELLIFSSYRGTIPLSLWRDTCNLYFSSNISLTTASAFALLKLRARVTSPPILMGAPLGFDSVFLLARLINIMMLDSNINEELLTSNAALWNTAILSLAENFNIDSSDKNNKALLALLQSARCCIEQREAAKNVVTTFT